MENEDFLLRYTHEEYPPQTKNKQQADSLPTGAEETNRPSQKPQQDEPDDRPQIIHR